MKHLVVSEHTRIERRAMHSPGVNGDVAFLEERHYDRIRKFDRTDREESDRVFDWYDGYARTKQWVGVVQAPGVQIEILPKADAFANQNSSPDTDQSLYESRRNLLYMLSLSGDVPIRSRDVARLSLRQAPLSETLAAIFADRLGRELLLGPERAYQSREENLRNFKGKLLVSRQAQHNAAHRERFFCRYDEFSEDTALNRIFRASCKALLEMTRSPATQDTLRHCLLMLDDVADVVIQESDFNQVTLNRQNERFEDVLRFCQLIFSGRTPTIQAGGTHTFSLLFDMNKVFERFVAAYLKKYVIPRIPGVDIFPQAVRHRRHLMECAGSGILRLEPDILLEAAGKQLVLDTKWKLLSPGSRGRGGVGDSDLYQLYAYTRRYGCRRSVLLYPHLPGLEARDFNVLDSGGSLSGESIAIRHVRLHRNLHKEEERRGLTEELEQIIRDGLGIPHNQRTEPASDAA